MLLPEPHNLAADDLDMPGLLISQVRVQCPKGLAEEAVEVVPEDEVELPTDERPVIAGPRARSR